MLVYYEQDILSFQNILRTLGLYRISYLTEKW